MPRPNLSRSGPWIGFGGLAVLLWMYVASVLFAPWQAVLALVVLWLGLLVLALGWARPHPRAVAGLPVVGLLAWLALVWAGGALLDWS